jgi:endonuclease/exonuclease/phosphatase family metal-dependent hydrolase
MQINVSGRNRRLLSRALLGLVFCGAASAASAQTTVTLNQPSQVLANTIRGGSFADKNDRSVLATRASDNLEYNRRLLLKFDTQNAIPAGSAVTSALLTVTVKTGSEDATRSIGVYQVTTSWNETQVTWNNRYTADAWTTTGGDLGSRLAVATVSNVPGTKATFDVTALVKEAVAGRLGSSRYTRLVLIDLEGSTSESYREYFLPSDSNAEVRPVLKVTYGGTTAVPPPPPPPTTTGSTLRVLHWNTHHGGIGTDGRLDTDRLVKKAASFKPDVVSFNEVETYNTNQPALFASLMKTYTGQTWYYKFTTGSGAAVGIGNMIMSRFPLDATDVQLLSYNRAVVNATIHVNGRIVNVSSTHLDADSSTYRAVQIGELTSWGRATAEQKIICGDFNTQPTTANSAAMKVNYYDSWAEAQADGTAIAYAGNTAGNTRNSRIDYIYYSHGASLLVLKSSQVFDVRDANGVMPSDHRPLLTVFTVK